MPVYLAVDAGGTSTRCVAVAETGECLGYGRAASGNPISAGAALASDSVVQAAAAALAQAGAAGRDVAGVLLAMAGSSAVTGDAIFAPGLAALGVTAPLRFAADLLATFSSGTWEPHGYALVAGTGAAAVRVEGGALARAADGLGWLVGDDGSGYQIGERVVRAASAHLDGRGPGTALTAALLDELGLRDDRTTRGGRPAVLERMIETLYALRPVELSRFARLAFAAADADAVAAGIVDDAADALLNTLSAVIVRSVTGPIVLGGGTVARHENLAPRIARAHPGQPVVFVEDGAVGATVLALRDAGAAVDAGVFARIETSLAALR
jgi:N-acetylglucosamine kinase-like BadF-type ATPase